MKISEIYSSNKELEEVRMTPTAIRSRISQIKDAKVGIEFELVVTDFSESKKSRRDSEPNWDADEDVSSDDWSSLRSDIRDFFTGEYNTTSNVLSEIDDAHINYRDWRDDRWDEYVAEEYEDWHRDYTDDDSDIDDQPYIEIFKSEKYDDFLDSQGSIKSWLEDQNLERMSNWVRKYDLTWPQWIHHDEDENDLRGYDEIAESFQKAVGIRTEYATEYHKAAKSLDTYMIEPDSSIKPNDKDTDDFGLEFVSPPLSLTDAIAQIKKVKAWAQAQGAYTNKTTGLHMNVSLPNYSRGQLDYVKLVVFLGDDWLSDQFGRKGNDYVRSSIDFINNRAKMNQELLPQALDKMKQGLNQLAAKTIHSGFTQKTMSVSVHDDRVEFRAPGNNWLEMDIDLIINSLYRTVVALDIALDPNKEQREYTTKLYKILSPRLNPDAVRLFIQYQEGAIGDTALKKYWAEQVLGFSTDTRTARLAGTKQLAKKFMKPYLKSFSIIKLPEGTIIRDIEDLSYEKALKRATQIVANFVGDKISWALYDHDYPKRFQTYVLYDGTGKFQHFINTNDPQDAYRSMTAYANANKIANWYIEPS